MPLLLSLLVEDLSLHSIFQLQLPLELGLPLPLSLLQLVLNALCLHPGALHAFLFVPASPQKVLLALSRQLLTVCSVLSELQWVKILAEDLKIDVSIAPAPQSVQQVIQLLICNVEIIVLQEPPQRTHSQQSASHMVDFKEGIVRSNTTQLFSTHLQDAEALQHLHQQ